MTTEPRKLAFQYVRHETPETLQAFLTRRFRYHTLKEWGDRIESGAVTVNGKRVAPEHSLLSREKIVYYPPRVPEPPIDTRFTVLYEDAHLLAVGKSSNIPTSPSGKYWYNCLRHLLQRELNLPEVHAVHRLDRETSGVNLFAKTRSAASALGKAFAAGAVEKRYAAILRGLIPAREILVNAPLQDEGGEISIKQAVHPSGRPSLTRFILRARLPGACLVDVRPLTGRTHQIRAHAAFLGTPVWGDRLYGASTSDFIAWAQNPERDYAFGHLLHAKSLRFMHPETGQYVEIKADESRLMGEQLS